MRKKLVIISLTFVVFLCAVVLGVSTVFRVDRVTVETTTVSELAKTESKALEKKIRETYLTKNSLFVDVEEIKAWKSEFPYLSVTSVEKDYPNGILVKVTEEKEAYAVKNGDEYYILNQTGDVLTTKTSSENRLDGQPNLLLEGFAFTGVENGTLVGDDAFSTALSVLKTADEILGGVRKNVLSLRLINGTPETIVCLSMREGVKVYVGNVSQATDEKVKKAIDEYLALSDGQKLTGRLLVSEAEGQLVVSYSETDEFQV